MPRPDRIDPPNKSQWQHGFTGRRAPSGPTGPRGPTGPTGERGAQGKDGTIRIAAAGPETLAAGFTAPSLHLILRSAEADQLGGRLEAAHRKLAWLVAMGAASHDGEAAGIARSARASLAHIHAGLDFFGHVSNYAPHVSFQVYRQVAESWLPFVKELEALREQYITSVNDLGARLQAFDEAQRSVRQAQERIEADIKWTEDSEIPVLAARCDELRIAHADAEDALRRTSEAYQQAVIERVHSESGGDCDFLQIVTVAAAVVPLAGTAWAGAAGIVATAASLSEVGATVEGVGQVIAAIRAVEGNVKEIAGAFAALTAAMPGEEPDALKVLVTQQSFDRTIAALREHIATHLGPAEAAAYDAVVQRFLDIGAARNKLLVMLNAASIRLEALRSDALRREEELNRIKDDRLKTDEGAVERLAFVVRAADDAKAHLLRAVYQEQKAQDYWALEHTPTTYLHFDTLDLEARHRALIEAVVSKAEDRTQDLQHFKVDPPLVIDDAAAQKDDAWAYAMRAFLQDLRETGRATLRLPAELKAFRNVRELLADRITVGIEGATSDDHRLHLILTHNGDSVFRTRTGTELTFSHLPRAVFLQYNLDVTHEATTSLGGKEGRFAYLSPFATWTMALRLEDNVGLLTKHIRRVTLAFDAFGTVPIEA